MRMAVDGWSGRSNRTTGCAGYWPIASRRSWSRSTIDLRQSIRYPAALDDVEAAWHWACIEARTLGADGARFAVAGDSSGGNLVAALTLRLARTGGTQPDAQLLFYPALDATCARTSYREFSTGYNLSAEQMAWYWAAYRGNAAPDVPELSPLAAPDLSGLPPAIVALAAADVLRGDGLDYARRLRRPESPSASSIAPARFTAFCAGRARFAPRNFGSTPISTAACELLASRLA